MIDPTPSVPPDPLVLMGSNTTTQFVNGSFAIAGYNVSRATIQLPSVLAALKAAIVTHISNATAGSVTVNVSDVFIIAVGNLTFDNQRLRRRLTAVRQRAVMSAAML